MLSVKVIVPNRIFANLFYRHMNHNKNNFSSATLEEKAVNLHGFQVNYLRAGSGDKKILCLPGVLGTIWSDFKPQIEGFDKNKFELIVWDPPGYGKSRPPNKTFNTKFYEKDAQVALDLMDSLHIPKYSILGWSDGANAAMILAAKDPRVEKLVVWGANSYVDEIDIKLYKQIEDTSKWSPKMKEPLVQTYGEKSLQDMMTSWYRALEDIQNSGGNICTHLLPQIKAPTLIVHGDQDPIVPGEHPEFIASKIPNSLIHHFEKGKHNLHLRFSSEFNALVQKFLLS